VLNELAPPASVVVSVTGSWAVSAKQAKNVGKNVGQQLDTVTVGLLINHNDLFGMALKPDPFGGRGRPRSRPGATLP
jgi:hypothetical protein